MSAGAVFAHLMEQLPYLSPFFLFKRLRCKVNDSVSTVSPVLGVNVSRLASTTCAVHIKSTELPDFRQHLRIGRFLITAGFVDETCLRIRNQGLDELDYHGSVHVLHVVVSQQKHISRQRIVR